MRVCGRSSTRPAQCSHPWTGEPCSRVAESEPRSGYDGYKRKRGSKVHMGHLLAVHVTPADEQERAQVLELCDAVRTATGHRSNSPGLTRAIRESNCARTQRDTASSCRSSSWQRRRRASCCCLGDGWSSAALPERRAFDLCPETTSGCPTYSGNCTSWSSPSSCCPK